MKVVIATNGLPASIHAIKEALRLLPLQTAEVFLVSVLDPEERIGSNANADQDLVEGRAILEGAGVKVQTVLRRGHFADEIVATAEGMNADLIVVGSERRGRIEKLFVGSVSAKVVEMCNRAVLVVRFDGKTAP